MRVIFAGTPEFARVALAHLHAAGFVIPLVLSQPDRPAGRGLKLQASSVKQWAEAHQIPVAQPRSLRLDGKYPEDAVAAKAAIEAARADVMVVAAYGLMLPQWLLDMFRFRCLNIHASLLPRWRGAAPIHRAIEAGDALTGVTIMQMDAGLDTGAMLLAASLPIAPADSTGSMLGKLALLGGELIAQALGLAARGSLCSQPQPAEGISYARKIEKHEAGMDWSQSAVTLERRIRAFNPSPIAFGRLGAETIRFHAASVVQAGVVPTGARPGQVLCATADGIDIACADGVLRALQLQKAGGKILPAADFLRGFTLTPGMVFDSCG